MTKVLLPPGAFLSKCVFWLKSHPSLASNFASQTTALAPNWMIGCFTTQPQGNISKNNLLDWRCLPAFYKIAKHYHDSCCYCQFNLKNIKKTLSHFKNRSLPKWQFLLEYTMRGQQQWLSEAFNIKETFLPNVHYAIKTRFLKSKSDYIKKLSTMKTNACIVNI